MSETKPRSECVLDSRQIPELFGNCPSLRVIAMPKDTNNLGTVFGGLILSYLDQAGYVEARKHGNRRWLTVAVDQVIFHAPVHVGDTISFYTRTIRTGTTSVTVDVLVQVERFETFNLDIVTQAQLTFVAVDDAGTPIPFNKKPC
jgi:acyl-CoA thioesterase YciA